MDKGLPYVCNLLRLTNMLLFSEPAAKKGRVVISFVQCSSKEAFKTFELIIICTWQEFMTNYHVLVMVLLSELWNINFPGLLHRHPIIFTHNVPICQILQPIEEKVTFIQENMIFFPVTFWFFTAAARPFWPCIWEDKISIDRSCN